MALTTYLNFDLKMHFPEIYSMQETSGHFSFSCPSGLTMVHIRTKVKLVKFYWNFSEYNFKKLTRTLITYFAYMFHDMRYNDTYAKHVNIGCENKKLN